MIHPGQRRLARVQVVNWGTLHGHHDLAVARKGFLITGNSGSGKSTLIDAISAVLVPGNQLRFNAAAQEATNSGRNFVTYIRGAWRREAGADTEGLVASYLRTGATWSGIALTYRAGTDDPPITLVKLMHLGRGQNAAGDVSHLHLILDHELDLTDFSAFMARGIDTRGIRKRWPEAAVNPTYAPFARSFRSRLGISTEGAQRLLHRTLSAKSLGSLDQLFRDYMLDTPSTFAMAERAVNQFHDLQEAHRVVVDARLQVEMLTPLVDLADTRRRGLESLRDTEEENAHLGAVHAEMTLSLLCGDRTERRALTPLLESGAAEATAAAERAPPGNPRSDRETRGHRGRPAGHPPRAARRGAEDVGPGACQAGSDRRGGVGLGGNRSRDRRRVRAVARTTRGSVAPGVHHPRGAVR
ncbi:ATP-binding protein [Rhodococcus koreensis]|uniref:ATP-binding protein n=1 Tax=Rhodococcus koreensis TaxID=99653 RepID=UPI0036702FC5